MASRTKITTVGKLYRKRNLLILLCLLFLLLSITIAILTYYGQSAGGFSIKLADEAEEMGLQLSTDPDFNTYSVRLIADSVSDAQPISYLDLLGDAVQEVKNTNGTYIPNTTRKGFIGYTFYVRNVGGEDVTLTSTFNITQTKQNVDKAMWVWAFFGEDDVDGTIYQARDEDTTATYPASYPSRSYFQTESRVFYRANTTLKVGTTFKISIIVWLEGYDPDCIDSGPNSILGGSTRYSMQLSIRDIVI